MNIRYVVFFFILTLTSPLNNASAMKRAEGASAAAAASDRSSTDQPSEEGRPPMSTPQAASRPLEPLNILGSPGSAITHQQKIHFAQVAHDLNGMIGGVVGMITLFEDAWRSVKTGTISEGQFSDTKRMCLKSIEIDQEMIARTLSKNKANLPDFLQSLKSENEVLLREVESIRLALDKTEGALNLGSLLIDLMSTKANFEELQAELKFFMKRVSKEDRGRPSRRKEPLRVLQRASLGIPELFQHLKLNLQELIKEYSCEYNVTLDAEIPAQLIGSYDILFRILRNLSSNSIKHSPKGHVEVSVSLLTSSDEAVLLHFDVKDDGLGMPIELQEQVMSYQYFVQRTSPEDINAPAGTGLGMTNVMDLLFQIGSKLKLVRSAPGKGSHFSFDVPYFRELPRHRVLIADDHPSNRQVLITIVRRLLKETSVVESAENGQQAVDMALTGGNHYDLIFMDSQMPVMNGSEAIAAIMKHSGENAPIIIGNTGHSEESPEAEAFKASGATLVLSKPTKIEMIESLLAEYLDLKKLTHLQKTPPEARAAAN